MMKPTCFLTLSFLMIVCLSTITQYPNTSISADNVCTFHIADKLFSLKLIQHMNWYQIDISKTQKIRFNFCGALVPDQCVDAYENSSSNSTISSAFAYLIQTSQISSISPQTNESSTITSYTCTPYTSDSYIYYFSTDYIKKEDQNQLILTMFTADKKKSTQIHIQCATQQFFSIDGHQFQNDYSKLVIRGESTYGCPVFQISSLWTTLEDSSFLFGFVMLVVGFQMLFYGLLMINITVFISGYFISFAVYGGIFTVFIGPDTGTITVYFALLFILLASTLTAYGLTKLINVSIFFIGALFGLIVGALVNTFFSGIFSIQTVWSLVFFQVLFTIPFGLMTLKYSDEVIILSTSLSGSYLVIRPISWILGGFPNQFVMYQMYQSNLNFSVPWTFYVYLLLIIVLAIMGGLYQYLKLQRSDQTNTISTNMITQAIQQPLDKIKSTVDKLIARYSNSDGGQQNYKKMKEMQYQNQTFQIKEHQTQYAQIGKDDKTKKPRTSKDSDQFY